MQGMNMPNEHKIRGIMQMGKSSQEMSSIVVCADKGKLAGREGKCKL